MTHMTGWPWTWELGNFGMSTGNFNAEKDQSGSYNIQFVQTAQPP